jgi:PAS domain S-box-containing protein
MKTTHTDELLLQIKALETQLAEAEELIEAIKAGEVDAFAVGTDNGAEVYTLQSGDYAYRELIEKFSEGALNLTEEGLIVYTNAYFNQLTGLPYETVMGTFIFNLIHPDFSTKFKDLFRQALTGSSKGEIKLDINGHALPVYVSLTSLQPKLATVGMIVTDLTEKKQHEKAISKYQGDLEELSKSDKLKSDFIKMASHELNTPVTSIKGYTQMLLSMLAQPDAEKVMPPGLLISSLGKIDKQILRMVRLISELLDMSRIEGGQLKLRKEIFTVNDLITEVIQDIKITNPRQTINLHFNTNCEIEADRDRISQVLSNLVLNAIKYSPHATDINITVDLCAIDKVAISIKDYGIGIDKVDHEKIFERFYRSEKNNEDTYPGFGIGLFISKEIIQRHNGTISVDSEKGKGSTFTITLSTILP